MKGDGEVSLKNTKQELLDAYQKLADRANSGRGGEGEETVPKRRKYSEVEGAVKGIEAAARTALSELVEKINVAAKELEGVNSELEESKQELLETHKLVAAAGALQDFLRLKVEEEAEWEKKFVVLRGTYDEETARLARVRKQQEQEYEYELSLRRRKDEDKFVAERQAKVEELERRELAVAEQEEELESLREKVAKFDGTLEKAVGAAVTDAEKALREVLEHKFALEKKDTETELKLKTQTVTGLEAGLKARDAEIAGLKTDLAASMQRVTALASSVITATGSLVQRGTSGEKGE